MKKYELIVKCNRRRYVLYIFVF